MALLAGQFTHLGRAFYPNLACPTQEALNYASRRNSLWLKMDSSRLTEKMNSASDKSTDKPDMEEFIETR